MANIKLSQAECRRNLLPDVCMFCGEQSTERKQKTFAWQPQWVWLLILASPLIAIIVAAILTKRMTVQVPVCEKHEGYWRRKTLILLGSFLLIAVVCIGGFVYMANQGPGPKDDLTGWVCGGGVVLFFIWLVAAAIYSANGIRPSEITDRSIRLQGVNEHFVAALEDDRDRDREEEAEYRRKRRAERELEDRDRDGERDRVRDRERDRDRDRPRSTERRRDDDDDLERRSRG